MKVANILLASHGTIGAKAAEKAALLLCGKNASLHHLIVVPTLWKGMTGDDWLNNGSTRDEFRDYLESELEKEVRANLQLVSEMCDQQHTTYTHEILVGELGECLVKSSQQHVTDLVVIGSPRPKGITGLRSRMSLEVLVRGLSVPLWVAPYPVSSSRSPIPW